MGSESDVDDLRFFLICFLECARRYVDNVNETSPDVISFSVLMDLEKVGLSNLAYDLVPTFYDLFHSHYPRISSCFLYLGIISTVYVLNYGWLHSSIYAIIKTMLPASATEKLIFVPSGEIQNYIPNHGKEQEWSAETCPIFSQFGRENYTIDTQLTRDIFMSLDAGPRSPSPVWYDAPTSPVLSHSSPALSKLVGEGRRKAVKSAADLQRLLRETEWRDAVGLDTLPRPPSSVRLSSLVMTPMEENEPVRKDAGSKRKDGRISRGVFEVVYAFWRRVLGRWTGRKGVCFLVAGSLMVFWWKKRLR
jgi:hypothetical protein